MRTLKELAHKGGAPVARFISAGLATIKNNPKKSIALAAVTLPLLVYGAAQLCVTYGAAATLAQPMSTASGTAYIAQTYVLNPVATACDWTMQTAAGQKASAAGSYVSSAMSSLWNSTKALAHDMWNHQTVAGDLKAAQAESLHAQEAAYTASLNPTTFTPAATLGTTYNAAAPAAYIEANMACAKANNVFTVANNALTEANNYQNQPSNSWAVWRWLQKSLEAPHTKEQLCKAESAANVAQETMKTACAEVAPAKAALGTTYNATILDEYIKANRTCAEAHGTISKAEEALKAAEAYGNQPASWKNLFGLLKTANGPDSVQQIRNAQLDVYTAKQATKTACSQADAAYNAVEAMKAQAAAQATVTRTAPIIEGLETRLGAAAFMQKALLGIPVIGTSIALAKLTCSGFNKIGKATGLTTDRYYKFAADINNWVDARLKRQRQTLSN
jgi:hypothetical protein